MTVTGAASDIPAGRTIASDRPIGGAARRDPDRCWPRTSAIELAAEPAAVPVGRRYVRRLLAEWKLDDLADDLELVTSELLANAIAASRPIGAAMVAIRVLASRERVLIEAWDTSPCDPRPSAAADDAETGRGLAVVAAVSHRWGLWRADRSLKVVWCELLTGWSAEPEGCAGPTGR